MVRRFSTALAFVLLTACSGHLNVGSSTDGGDSGRATGGRDSGNDGSPSTNPPPGPDSSDGAPAPMGTQATVNGTPGGQALSPAYAIAFKGVNDPAYPNQVSVFISDIDNLCSLAQTGGQASFSAMMFVLGQTDSAAPPVGPGTYTATSSPNEGTLGYYNNVTLLPPGNNGDCAGTFIAGADGASVVISAVGASIAGTFDVTFGSDHVTGSFDAPLCDLDRDPDAGALFCL
jgi:hypothetical protein